MTSRERLITALNHKEPDRIPFDIGSTIVSGIQAVEYNKLKKALGIESGEVYVYDPLQQLAWVEDEVRCVLGIDTKAVVPDDISARKPGELTDGSPSVVPEGFTPEVLPDGSKVTRDKKNYWGANEENAVTQIMPPDGYYYDIPYHPLQPAKTKEDIDRFTYYWDQDEAVREHWKQNLDDAVENTEYGVVVDTLWGGYGQNYEVLENLRGWDTFLMDLMTEKELSRYMLDTRLEAVLKRWDMMLGIVESKPQVVCIGDDLGIQSGLQLPPDVYRDMIKPVHKKFIEFIKARTDAKIFFHSCGSVYEVIPDLIEIGLDILNPVQVFAANMDSKRLKKEFGNDLVFWGGIDTQSVLPIGTEQDVKDEVKRRIDDFGPGGGFVFNTSHNIQLDVPVKNLFAMFEAFEQYA
jgi:uroporphyrinogen decarboxylase